MKILTDCAECGRVVEIDPSAARLVVFRSSSTRPRRSARFDFECPSCGRRGAATVRSEVERRLARLGVPSEIVEDPRERHPSVLGRRMTRSGALPDAPPFTEGDVRTLRDLLDRNDWFEQLADEM